MTNPIAKFLYRFNALRQLGKKFMSNRMISQPFYNGVICFNAVEFASFWVKDASCEKTDKEIQDKLLALSEGKDLFVDIGSNIGIMTLSIALRNPTIQVTAFDPNQRILEYLRKSIAKNKLNSRVTLVNAAVSDEAGKAHLNFSTNSYSGHIASEGIAVDVINFADLLKENRNKKVLFKMDIEGFEKKLVPLFVQEKNPLHCFVVEIHPKGLNGISDPDFVLQQLFSNGFTVTDVNGRKISSRSEITDWDNVVCYYQA